MHPSRILPFGFQLVILLLCQLSWQKGAFGEETLILITDSPYEIWKGSQSKVQVVVFDTSFRPVTGAHIFAGATEVGQTDADGTLIFNHQPHGRFLLRAELQTGDKTASGSVNLEAYRRTGSFQSANLFVYTDRGVYRPGEEVLVRAMNWRLRGDFEPIGNAAVETLLRGPFGQLLTGDQMVTDPFGIASTRLRIPEDAPEGPYTLVVRHAGAEESARLRVERFRPPAILIEHSLPRFIAPQTKDLKVEVKLRYFTGGFPESGTLETKVSYAGRELSTQRQAILGGKPLTYQLDLDPIRKVVPDGERFQVKLVALDPFGRTDELTRDILYTKRPYQAIPDLDKDGYCEGEEVTLTVRLIDPDGIPVRGKEIQIDDLDKKLRAKALTDTGGVAAFKFSMPNHPLSILGSTDDVPDALFRSEVFYLEKKPLRANLPEPVVTERHRTPIVVTFDPAFVPAERVVHGDVVDYSGAIVQSFKIPIQHTEGGIIAKGTFQAPVWGSMLVTLYTVGMDASEKKNRRRPAGVGLLTEGLSLTSLPDKELRIQLDGVPDQAPPRSEVQAQFQVKSPVGRLVSSSLGIMLVDRAVLSLFDPLEKTPMDRFYNPTLKVLSTTGSDILTWPVVTRNWGYNQYDIALPPFGFQEGGPVNLPNRNRAKLASEGKASKGILGMLSSKPSEAMADILEGGAVGDGYGAGDSEGFGGLGIIGRGPSGGGDESQEKPPQKIVIRTDLPETSAWEPKLLAKDGKASFSFRLPEALTEQELIVVASDRQGGVGLLRKPIRVTQPIFVRSDLPKVMVAGDHIEARVLVQNTTEKELQAEVKLWGDGLAISPELKTITVAPQSAAVAGFSLSAQSPGNFSYQVQARAGDSGDGEKQNLQVRPRGTEKMEEQLFSLEAAQPFSTQIELLPDEYVEAHLEIAFPTIIPALQEIDSLLDRSAWWADSAVATPLAAVSLERYLIRHFPKHPRRAALRDYLDKVAVGLQAAIRPDGGFAWWRTGNRSNLYATAQALRLMAALREADIQVPDDLFVRTVGYLRRQRAQDGLFTTDDIAFWEGQTEKVRLQVSAFVFRALAEAALQKCLRDDRGWIQELSKTFSEYLDKGPDDVLTAAEAAMGLWALERSSPKKTLEATKSRLGKVARQLLAMRKTTHWEPSWFHAYGGTIEATVAALELLSKLDPRAFEQDLREGLLFLLSTRNEWGQWHCPFGTAEAIRAFTFLPPPQKEVLSEVSVTLGTKQLTQVTINPKDPFLSAIQLRHIALGSLLRPGKNDVRVTYSGKLKAPLRLVVSRWPASPKQPITQEGIHIRHSLAKSEISVGEPVEATLFLPIQRNQGEMRLWVPLPSNTKLVNNSLENLRKQPGVVSASMEKDQLVLLVMPSGDLTLSYQLEGERIGQALLKPVQARSAWEESFWLSSEGLSLTVR